MEYTYETGEYGVDILHAPYALLVEAFGNDGINPRDAYKSMCQWVNDDEDWEVYDYKVGTCYLGAYGAAREDITEWHVQAAEKPMREMRALLDAAVIRMNAEVLEDEYRKANGDGVEWDTVHALVGKTITYRLKYTQIQQSGERAVSWGTLHTDTVREIAEPFLGQFQVITEANVRLRWGTDEITELPTVVDELKADMPDYSELIGELGDGGTVRVGAEGEDGLWTGGGLEINLSSGVQAGCSAYTGDDADDAEYDGPLSLADVRKAHALLGAYLALVDAEQD